MDQALDDHQDDRLEELGQHLHLLFQQGVAPNLLIARKSIPVRSHQEMRLESVRNRSVGLILPLEERLKNSERHEPAAERARVILANGRAEVYRSINAR